MCSDAQEYAAPNCQETANPNTSAEAKRTCSDCPALAATTDEDRRQARVDSCSMRLGGTRSTMNMDRNLEIKFGSLLLFAGIDYLFVLQTIGEHDFFCANVIVDSVP